jgi:5-methylcytosine-specific restriction endonuclease McrA
MKPPEPDAIALAERVLGILNEGSFSSTYKYALFIAVLDLCIEKFATKTIPPETLTTPQIAAKVIELYWPHAMAYGRHGTLRQGGSRADQQAEILRAVAVARARWSGDDSGTVARFKQRHQNDYRKLVDDVEWTLVKWPIPRLQRLGKGEDRFLYQYYWADQVREATVRTYQRQRGDRDTTSSPRSSFDHRLLLQPGVAENLIRLNGVLRPLFYREWAVMVARMNALPEAELERFLFGTERASLYAVRGPLRELQGGRCFYCDDRLTGGTDVDHFIPWSRYPDDGVDNLVAAHPKCNNSKRDFLAAEEHLERWVERGRASDADLRAAAQKAGWHRDAERSTSVARAIYLRLPATARLWRRPDDFVAVDRERIRSVLA